MTDIMETMAKLLPELDHCFAETEDRKAMALGSCAGNRFPDLLRLCAEKDRASGTDKEVTELLSYLDPYWKHEYQNVIRRAHAKTARVTPLSKDTESSALAKYIKKESPSNPGPGV